MQLRRSKLIEDNDAEEGFERNPTISEEIIIQPRRIEETFYPFNSIMIPQSKSKTRYSSEKPILKINAIDGKTKNPRISDFIMNKRHNYQQNFSQNQPDQGEEESEFILKRKNKRQARNVSMTKVQQLLESVIIKTKRVQIALNLTLNIDNNQMEELISQEKAKKINTQIVFKQKLPSNTFTFFKQLLKNTKQSSFIHSKYNVPLRLKIQKAKLLAESHSKKYIQKHQQINCLEFYGDFESGNIDFATKVNENEYNVFLRIDTNTKGHQSWFYFKVLNKFKEQKPFRLNICNIKRSFKMMEQGQKIYTKDDGSDSVWMALDNPVQILVVERRKYKISFEITLKPNEQKFISLIPPYTYSNLLKDLEDYEKSPDIKVDVLTYSVTGLAVPLITITKGAARPTKMKNSQKKLYLISGRIHPSQTCSSYIINGLIRELLKGDQSYQDFLNSNIIKIVPMLNPDGVVFGNFRTNYLGDDLNRSFHRTDDTVYPQIIALKELGRIYQTEYGQNFIGFIDLHGHSCQTNSFAYGPEYDEKSDLFVQCRVFPKILDRVSKYFKYDMSEFKLQDYKFNTARGFFLKKLKIPSYTIQTSYALYYDKDKRNNQPRQMSVTEWKDFGKEIANSLYYYYKYLDTSRQNLVQNILKKAKDQKRSLDLKAPVIKVSSSAYDQMDFQNLKKQIQKQVSKQSKSDKTDKQQNQDSDGESCDEDLSEEQKQLMIRKLKEVAYSSYLFPKVNKASLILPSVVPSIMILGKSEEKIISTMPRIANKFRQKKLIRPTNLSYQYTQYLLKNMQGIGALKPEITNFGIAQKKKGPQLSIQKFKKQQN